MQLDSAVPSLQLHSAWLQGQQLLALREAVSVRIDAPAASPCQLVMPVQQSQVVSTCRHITDIPSIVQTAMAAVVVYQQMQYLVETTPLQNLLLPLEEAYCDERAAGYC